MELSRAHTDWALENAVIKDVLRQRDNVGTIR